MRALRRAALVPRNVVIALLNAYRLVISPLYGDVCRYHPSCSAYSLRAVQVHGVLRGGFLTGRRLVRCHPWAAGGIDDVPEPEHRTTTTTARGFVVQGTSGT
ncbi:MULTISPECIES: membrane protein insertion efficiency factor YidD [unclassified Pseudoclavibacter]|uniref:membrane protein insertion efficiency factor YidD n=1 Tax=Pseudoclavibacter sp. RFBB5 TaxID=2080574 RepID=UPI000CE88502|nr:MULTISPECIES: membrane protein insertion efficiency factor YidD [unclassified Pseudoclavibacter]MBS3179094.1 membrane protein insertion efficiency factor YidD [Pseudoclavibacter sp. Marseille-Q4354]PPG32157.1 membrane protein insertion efficiency factor YidD [Pseudoclavibacter sp. RFBB5]